jgi:hypothetical protein
MNQKWDASQAACYGAFLGALFNTVGTFGGWTYDLLPERIGGFVWSTVVCALMFAAVAVIGSVIELMFTRVATIGDAVVGRRK